MLSCPHSMQDCTWAPQPRFMETLVLGSGSVLGLHSSSMVEHRDALGRTGPLPVAKGKLLPSA